MSRVVLYQYPRFGPLPSMSPYCWKVQLALAARGVAFELTNLLLPKKVNPRGKLPYLEWDGEGIEDSTAIVRAIDARAGDGARLIPTDPGLAAEAHMLEDWADESLYWHGVWAKFVDEEGYGRIRGPLIKGMPPVVGGAAVAATRKRIAGRVAAQGLSKRAPELILEEFERHLDVLDRRLADRAYLVGNQLSIADIAVTPMLAQLTYEFTPKHAARIMQTEHLAPYLARIREQVPLDRAPRGQ